MSLLRTWRWSKWLALALCWWGGGAVVWGQAMSPRLQLRSLQAYMEELYSARFGLDQAGVPTVTIGVMDGQTRISFVSPRRVVAVYFQADGSPRWIWLQAGRRYTITRLRGRPAEINHAVVAFSLRRARWSRWKALAAKWKKRGFRVRRVVTGSVFAVRGRLFDNRRVLGVIGVEERAFRARLKASRLTTRYQEPVQVTTVLERRSSGMLRLTGGGKRLFSKGMIQIRSTRGGVQVDRVEFGRGYSWHRYQRRTFLGSLVVTLDRDARLALLNRVSLPHYLAGLLAAEMPLGAPVEALRAQSVCARNEILAKVGTRHLADPYLFCAHTHCQVYTGVHRAHRKIASILRSTRGEVMLTAKGHLADASYSSICGGHTEHNEHVWGGQPRPALRGKLDVKGYTPAFQNGITEKNIRRWLSQPPDSFCRAASPAARRKFRWTKTLRASRLNALVNRRYPVGAVQALKVRKRGVSGRARALQIKGDKGTHTVRGELRIRRLLGNLNSSMFVVDPVTDMGGRVLSWRFTGGGWGHGVGMCQYGAIGRARAGQTYRKILRHYFSQVALVKLYQ